MLSYYREEYADHGRPHGGRVRRDRAPAGTPHVTPEEITQTSAGEGAAPVALCQVDGARWASIEGRAVVLEEAASVRHAELLYTMRYRRPRENPDRVAIRVAVTRTLGRVG